MFKKAGSLVCKVLQLSFREKHFCSTQLKELSNVSNVSIQTLSAHENILYVFVQTSLQLKVQLNTDLRSRFHTSVL